MVVATVAACQSRRAEPDPAQPDPVAAPELSVNAEVRRSVEEPRVVAVVVANHGDQPVRVERAELVSESFAATGPAEVDVRVPANGLRRDVFVRYGEGRCHGDVAPPAGPAQARLRVATIDDRRHEVELDLPHPNVVLDRLLRDECATQLLARTARLELESWSAMPDGRLGGTLVLERLGGEEPVALHDVTGNVLFRFTVDPADTPRPVARLPAGQDRVEIPVIADAGRCDGHAIGEAKRRYVLPAWVTVGSAERLPTVVGLDDSHRDQLKQMHAKRCGS